MKVLYRGALCMVVAIVGVNQAQTAKMPARDHDSAKEKLIGAWHLVRIVEIQTIFGLKDFSALPANPS